MKVVEGLMAKVELEVAASALVEMKEGGL